MKSQFQDKQFAAIEIELDVTVPGTFSAIIASDFSDMFPYLTLFEKHNYPQEPLYREDNHILDDVELNDDHWSRDEDVGVARNHQVWDHLSTLEVSYLEKGEYILLVSIPQAHWFHVKNTVTCLSFDFMMEFLPKDASTSEDSMFLQDEGAVTVMSVFPP